MKRVLFILFWVIQFGIAGASDHDMVLNHTIKAVRLKETRVCSQAWIDHLESIGANEETIKAACKLIRE